VAVCFDAAHPAHAAAAAAAGADLYLGSALYAEDQARRSDLRFGARAMDHRMFTARASDAGSSGRYTSCGGSGAWHPTGDVICRAPRGEETTFVVDLERRELDALAMTRAASSKPSSSITRRRSSGDRPSRRSSIRGSRAPRRS
jgi:predicted amidohydrolase